MKTGLKYKNELYLSENSIFGASFTYTKTVISIDRLIYKI